MLLLTDAVCDCLFSLFVHYYYLAFCVLCLLIDFYQAIYNGTQKLNNIIDLDISVSSMVLILHNDDVTIIG